MEPPENGFHVPNALPTDATRTVAAGEAEQGDSHEISRLANDFMLNLIKQRLDEEKQSGIENQERSTAATKSDSGLDCAAGDRGEHAPSSQPCGESVEKEAKEPSCIECAEILFDRVDEAFPELPCSRRDILFLCFLAWLVRDQIGYRALPPDCLRPDEDTYSAADDPFAITMYLEVASLLHRVFCETRQLLKRLSARRRIKEQDKGGQQDGNTKETVVAAS
ncbi:hypothetical protein VTK73DRAFT_2989 [Phialemonium thermophilum]|uniref:Uncharacterized protein n=1 Tax=Phialemonium thermophilum TaxID=223376 RepID=A0ABR3Y291_9PEZI